MTLTEILIASYSKDIPYLEWCLKSIDKFATGFSGTTLIVAHDEIGLFKKFQNKATVVTYHRVADQNKWQIQAQAQKCMADVYCAGADFVLHTDSDCIFTEPVTPDDYIIEGKPVMLIENYDRLNGNPWKKVTEDVLRFPVKYETMRRHPQVNPIGIYRDLRRHIETVHKQEFQPFVLSRKHDFPWGFSEHCAIGAFALSRPEWREKYCWIDLEKEPSPTSSKKLIQFWSHRNMDQDQETPTGLKLTPLEVCQRIIGT
jgi:hypothetical protein